MLDEEYQALDSQEYSKLPKELRKLQHIFDKKSYGELEHVKRLMAKVIKIALIDLASNDLDAISDAFYFFEQKDLDPSNIMSFENICLIFHVDANYIREKIFEFCEARSKLHPMPVPIPQDE